MTPSLPGAVYKHIFPLTALRLVTGHGISVSNSERIHVFVSSPRLVPFLGPAFQLRISHSKIRIKRLPEAVVFSALFALEQILKNHPVDGKEFALFISKPDNRPSEDQLNRLIGRRAAFPSQ